MRSILFITIIFICQCFGRGLSVEEGGRGLTIFFLIFLAMDIWELTKK